MTEPFEVILHPALAVLLETYGEGFSPNMLSTKNWNTLAILMNQSYSTGWDEGFEAQDDDRTAAQAEAFARGVMVGKLQVLASELGRVPKLRDVPFRHALINVFGSFSKGIEAAFNVKVLPGRRAA